MKKVKTLCLLFITIISLQLLSSCEFMDDFSLTIFNHNLRYNDFEYKIVNNNAVITKYVGNNDNVVIPSSIEKNDKSYDVIEIGEEAFYEYDLLIDITIPRSVKTIDDDAFFECDSLTNVYYSGAIEDWCNITFDGWGANPMSYASHFYMLDENNNYKEVTSIEIPSTIISIGSYQFCEFNNVTSITIPSSVTTIGSSAFEDCSSLTSIVISSSVNSIGHFAFFNCSSLTNIYYSGTIEDWCNIIFDGRGSNPMEHASHFYMLDDNNNYKEVTSIEIPSTITSIGDFQFVGFKNVTSITISSSVTSIGRGAFSGCSSLIIYCEASCYPDGLIYSWDYDLIDPWDYDGDSYNPVVYCGVTKKDIIQKDGIEYLIVEGKAVITRYVGSDDNVIIPSIIEVNGTTYDVTEIGEYAFSNSGVKSVIMDNNIVEINKYAFYKCNSLETITLPFIGENYYRNNYLGYIFGAKSNKEYYDKNFDDYVPTSLKKVIILEGITSIEEYAFYECDFLTNIKIPNSVTTIGSYAFYGCNSLTSIVIPSSVETIENYAFSGCFSLTIYCEESNKLNNWGNEWNYYGSSSENVYYRPVYYGVKKEDIIEIDGIEYLIIEGKAVITRYIGSDDNVVVPSIIEVNGNTYDVTEIGKEAFSKSSVKSIIIYKNIKIIGERAFSNCGSLTIYCETSSKPSGWSSYWKSDRPVYYGVTKEDIIEKDGIEYLIIEGKAVVTRYVGNDDNVVISSKIEVNGITYSVTEIGEYAFSFSNIKSIMIPNSVTTIGSSAFSRCSSLASITIPSSVTTIGSYCFYWCDSLKTVKFENNSQLELIENCAFFGCTSLESVVIPSSVTTIEENAFHNYGSLNIYCEVNSEPSGWNKQWNTGSPKKPKVFWANEWHYVDGVPVAK